jgi:hypothetical protein
MQLRHVLVAVAAATFVAGSSVGAFAGKSHSKPCGCGPGYNHSEAKVVSVGVGSYPAFAITLQGSESTSFATGGGGAGGGASTSGGAIGVKYSNYSYHGATTVSAAAAWGSTSANSCAGSGCGP